VVIRQVVALHLELVNRGVPVPPGMLGIAQAYDVALRSPTRRARNPASP
jgi:hypothetical protein